jgi:hypothetical protein
MKQLRLMVFPKGILPVRASGIEFILKTKRVDAV